MSLKEHAICHTPSDIIVKWWGSLGQGLALPPLLFTGRSAQKHVETLLSQKVFQKSLQNQDSKVNSYPNDSYWRQKM